MGLLLVAILGTKSANVHLRLGVQAGCALGHREALRGHYVVAEPIGATFNSSILSNHDEVPPVQSSTIVNSGLKSVTFSPHDQDSIVQIHLFEYEMSRGLKFSMRGKSRS